MQNSREKNIHNKIDKFGKKNCIQSPMSEKKSRYMPFLFEHRAHTQNRIQSKIGKLLIFVRVQNSVRDRAIENQIR